MSTECLTEKGMYIDEQANDTDRFISQCLWFDTNSASAFITSKTLYKCYLKMLEVTYNKEFREDSKETPTQRQFTTWLKKHVEFQHSYTQKRTGDSEFPEWGFQHIAFTEFGRAMVQKAGIGQESPSPQPEIHLEFPPKPDDNPFEASPQTGLSPLTDDDGNEIDIF